MENVLKKKYGLLTTICMVIGIIIGSGIFFKAQDILIYTKGNILYGVLAFLIGGIIMIACSFNFANFATKYQKINGLIDYSEIIVGSRYSYFVGWFISAIYFPSLTSVLAYASSKYTLILFNRGDYNSGLCVCIGFCYLILSFGINVLSPKIAGKFQISSTIIKIIPLLFIGLIGTIIGLFNGNININLINTNSNHGLFQAIVSVMFAYDGWIIATTINSEVKNSKRNLPLALILGTTITILIYILYFIGLFGGASINDLIENGVAVAFFGFFGGIGGVILNVFVLISCLGTLNGLMMATTRSFYSLAVRGLGPNPSFLKQIDFKTNMPTNSSILGLIITAFWFFYFFSSNLDKILGFFSFDSSELPVVTLYALYIPIFLMFIIKEGKKNIFYNVIIPMLGILASMLIVAISIYSHGILPLEEALANNKFSFPILSYLIVFFIIMLIGLLFNKKNKRL